MRDVMGGKNRKCTYTQQRCTHIFAINHKEMTATSKIIYLHFHNLNFQAYKRKIKVYSNYSSALMFKEIHIWLILYQFSDLTTNQANRNVHIAN